MSPSCRSCGFRLVMALGTSLGIGHLLFREMIDRLGPLSGLLAGAAATAFAFRVVFAVLEWSLRSEQRPSYEG